MKFLKYCLIWLAILMIFASVGGYTYIRLEGKHLFEKQLVRFFGQPVEVDDVRYLFPVGIRLIGLKIHNVLDVQDVRLHLRVPFLLKKYFVIARLELYWPVFHLVRYGDKQVDFGGVYLKREEEKFRTQSTQAQSRIFQGIIVDILSIEDGEVMIVDLAVDDPVKYEVTEMKGKAMQAVYPLENRQIRFDVRGLVRSTGGKSFLTLADVNAMGWMNWPARAMDVEVVISQPAGLSARMTVKGKDNQAQVEGRFEVDMTNAAVSGVAKELPTSDLGEVVLGAMRASQSKLALNIHFETEMDAFSFGLVDFQGEWLHSEKKKIGTEPAAGTLFGILPMIAGGAPKQ